MIYGMFSLEKVFLLLFIIKCTVQFKGIKCKHCKLSGQVHLYQFKQSLTYCSNLSNKAAFTGLAYLPHGFTAAKLNQRSGTDAKKNHRCYPASLRQPGVSCSHKVARNTGICIIFEQNEGNTRYLVFVTHKIFGPHQSKARFRALHREGSINLKSFLKSCNDFQFPVATHVVVLQAFLFPQFLSQQVILKK